MDKDGKRLDCVQKHRLISNVNTVWTKELKHSTADLWSLIQISLNTNILQIHLTVNFITYFSQNPNINSTRVKDGSHEVLQLQMKVPGGAEGCFCPPDWRCSPATLLYPAWRTGPTGLSYCLTAFPERCESKDLNKGCCHQGKHRAYGALFSFHQQFLFCHHSSFLNIWFEIILSSNVFILINCWAIHQ